MEFKDYLIDEIGMASSFFLKTASIFNEWDSSFAPRPGMLTASQQIGLAAETALWLIESGFNENPPKSDFGAVLIAAKKTTSLQLALAALNDQFNRFRETITEASADYLCEVVTEGQPLLGGMPRFATIPILLDQCAQIRGSLEVYARLLGKTPPSQFGPA